MFKTTQSILLADENGATRAFLKDNLAADGYQVIAAADRAQAIALLGADADLQANDAARLARLAELARPASATH